MVIIHGDAFASLFASSGNGSELGGAVSYSSEAEFTANSI